MKAGRSILYITQILATLVCAQPKQKADNNELDSTLQNPQPTMIIDYQRTPAGNPIVFLKTTRGDIEIEVFEKDCPNHAGNFIKLVRNGFYDNLPFHRILPETMIVTGDPRGDGSGNPGYFLDRENTPYPNKAGYVGMLPADNGRVNGSQFFILARDHPGLDSSVSCFAKVITGFENVIAIAAMPAENGKPKSKIKLMEAFLKPIETNPVVPDKTIN